MGQSAQDQDDAVARAGYDPDFLGTPVGLPVLEPGFQDDALMWEGAEVIDYSHFSLCMSRSRRFARWVGWNIDGAGLKLLPRTDIAFAKDPRLPATAQVGNELYAGNRLIGW